jgi:hypothetical protein
MVLRVVGGGGLYGGSLCEESECRNKQLREVESDVEISEKRGACMRVAKNGCSVVNEDLLNLGECEEEARELEVVES